MEILEILEFFFARTEKNRKISLFRGLGDLPHVPLEIHLKFSEIPKMKKVKRAEKIWKFLFLQKKIPKKFPIFFRARIVIFFRDPEFFLAFSYDHWIRKNKKWRKRRSEPRENKKYLEKFFQKKSEKLEISKMEILNVK